ncbi:MAG: GNAT family N-acetyltransferase [Methanobacteriaceae archaeon]|nr:GNAT family N-acetyltransferase [Methanobacteriaceae archaeon]
MQTILIEDLVVEEKYKRKGVRKSLMNEMEKIAIKNDCYLILFITEKNIDNAIAFYESLGFNPDPHKGFKLSLKE